MHSTSDEVDLTLRVDARTTGAEGVVVLDLCDPAGADLPAWGPPPSAIAVLKAVKTALDPQGRFGPGRFAPWMATP